MRSGIALRLAVIALAAAGAATYAYALLSGGGSPPAVTTGAPSGVAADRAG